MPPDEAASDLAAFVSGSRRASPSHKMEGQTPPLTLPTAAGEVWAEERAQLVLRAEECAAENARLMKEAEERTQSFAKEKARLEQEKKDFATYLEDQMAEERTEWEEKLAILTRSTGAEDDESELERAFVLVSKEKKALAITCELERGKRIALEEEIHASRQQVGQLEAELAAMTKIKEALEADSQRQQERQQKPHIESERQEREAEARNMFEMKLAESTAEKVAQANTALEAINKDLVDKVNTLEERNQMLIADKKTLEVTKIEVDSAKAVLLDQAREKDRLNATLTANIAQLEAKASTLEANMSQIVEATKAGLESNQSGLETKMNAILEANQRSAQSLEDRNAVLVEKNAELEVQMRNHDRQVKELEAMLAAESAEMEAKTASVTAIHTEFEAQSASWASERADLKAQLRHSEETLQQREAHIKQLSSQLETESARLDVVDASLGEAKRAGQAFKTRFAHLEETKESWKAESNSWYQKLVRFSHRVSLRCYRRRMVQVAMQDWKQVTVRCQLQERADLRQANAALVRERELFLEGKKAIEQAKASLIGGVATSLQEENRGLILEKANLEVEKQRHAEDKEDFENACRLLKAEMEGLQDGPWSWEQVIGLQKENELLKGEAQRRLQEYIVLEDDNARLQVELKSANLENQMILSTQHGGELEALQQANSAGEEKAGLAWNQERLSLVEQVMQLERDKASLQKENRLLVDQIGSQTEAQPSMSASQVVSAARKLFDDFDEDAKGTIDGAELENLSRKVWYELGKGVPALKEVQSDVDNLLKQFDMNQDGEINFGEFLGMLCSEPWDMFLPPGGSEAIQDLLAAFLTVDLKAEPTTAQGKTAQEWAQESVTWHQEQAAWVGEKTRYQARIDELKAETAACQLQVEALCQEMAEAELHHRSSEASTVVTEGVKACTENRVRQLTALEVREMEVKLTETEVIPIITRFSPSLVLSCPNVYAPPYTIRWDGRNASHTRRMH